MSKTVLLFNPDPAARKRPWIDRRPAKALPLNLLSLAAPLLRAGYSVKIIDEAVEPGWKKTLIGELQKKPLCVGISLMGGSRATVALLKACRLIKEKSRTPVVLGGAHPTLLPEQTLQNRDIDILIRGDGEEAFLEVAQALETGSSLAGIAGISYREKEGVVHTPDRPLIDLDRQPPLPYQLIEMEKYILKGPGYRILHFMSARGCPSHCSFCHQNAYKPGVWRAMSAQRTLGEITRLKTEFGVNGIYFLDENFFVDRKRAQAILQGLIERELNAPYHTVQARIDTLFRFDDEDLKLLEDAGASALDIGVESGSEKVLKILHKNIDLKEVRSFNKRLNHFRIHPHYTFMVGFPQESQEDLHRTVSLFLELIKENSNSCGTFAVYRPVPGTELFRRLQQYGFRAPQSLEEWASYPGIDDPGTDKPWISPKRRQLLIDLRFGAIALFAGQRHSNYQPASGAGRYFLSALSKVYEPVIRYRMENFDFRFFLERFIVKCVVGEY